MYKSAIRTGLAILFSANLLQVHAQQLDSLKKIGPQRYSFSTKQLKAPAMLIIAGIASNGKGEEAIKNEVEEQRNALVPKFHTTIDNYLQFSPIVAAYALDAAGVKSKTDIANRSMILLKGELGMLGTVFLVKSLTHTLRPDGSTYNSFPSGHTAQAFAAATFLSQEYKDRYPWMPYAAYGVASSVGFLRMANNRHFISDVLVGAGIGILSMKASYWTHQYKFGRKKERLDKKIVF
ncbi:phosphatase PAP2 family protein [Ferruginibacter sp. HRS2-29]|uniref:phosphatase PAP2 family protein n=1 Tax=Ferruginibacter sp. HRS2-29 TaxID=2487334 RepID=UPI0020CBCFE4|nr:phosphatase PAP2 family protein [Ferruginibacter sp. HRS2-29]MCP9752469.1 phosphatase PAP2 family protein [Ferruginibacter sp. HRS2-29]